VNVVREDPVRRGLLYAGTEKGMYVSFDDGDSWQSLQKNLPVTSVRDIDVHGNDVVIATHGRAFWIMDDVSPLRQTITSETFLFKPATTIRERPAVFPGSPMRKGEPMAANPPFGAIIDYVLSGAEAITLEIFDASNTLVRRYSSADKAPVPDPAKLTTAPEWFNTSSILSTTHGMHRFVWTLHYPPPAALARGRGEYADGVWAPPGNYKVVLTVNGQRLTQPLVVAPDPRINLPAAAYAEQFAMAKQIEAARVAVAAAREEAGAAMKKLTDQTQKNRLNEIADIVPEEQWWLAPRSTTSLRFLDAALQKLESAVDGADAAPTTDARASWAQLKPAVDAALRAWSEFKR